MKEIKMVNVVPMIMKGHELGGIKWVVDVVIFATSFESVRRFRSKRKAFAWAEREAKRVGGWVRNFHKMSSKQRKAYWRKVSEVAE